MSKFKLWPHVNWSTKMKPLTLNFVSTWKYSSNFINKLVGNHSVSLFQLISLWWSILRVGRMKLDSTDPFSTRQEATMATMSICPVSGPWRGRQMKSNGGAWIWVDCTRYERLWRRSINAVVSVDQCFSKFSKPSHLCITPASMVAPFNFYHRQPIPGHWRATADQPILTNPVDKNMYVSYSKVQNLKLKYFSNYGSSKFYLLRPLD